jgi:hypothetical protein
MGVHVWLVTSSYNFYEMIANQPFKIVITKYPSLNKLTQNTKALGLEILLMIILLELQTGVYFRNKKVCLFLQIHHTL